MRANPVDPRFVSQEVDKNVSYMAIRWFSFGDNFRALADEYLLTDCDVIEAMHWLNNRGSEPPYPHTGVTLSIRELWACYPTNIDASKPNDSVAVLVWTAYK